MTVTDEILMAYVDGEAAPDDAARIEAAAAADGELAARIERQRGLKARLANAFGGALDEEPPARLVEAVTSEDKVVDLQTRRAARGWPAWAGMAACLALGLAFGSQVGGRGFVNGDFTAKGSLASALDNQLASQPVGANKVRIGLSFRAEDGRHCRTFQTPGAHGLAGVACHGADSWQVVAAAPQAAPSGEFRAAASIPPTVARVVGPMMASEVFTAQEEAGAKARGWK